MTDMITDHLERAQAFLDVLRHDVADDPTWDGVIAGNLTPEDPVLTDVDLAALLAEVRQARGDGTEKCGNRLAKGDGTRAVCKLPAGHHRHHGDGWIWHWGLVPEKTGGDTPQQPNHDASPKSWHGDDRYFSDGSCQICGVQYGQSHRFLCENGEGVPQEPEQDGDACECGCVPGQGCQCGLRCACKTTEVGDCPVCDADGGQ